MIISRIQSYSCDDIVAQSATILDIYLQILFVISASISNYVA